MVKVKARCIITKLLLFTNLLFESMHKRFELHIAYIDSRKPLKGLITKYYSLKWHLMV